MLVLLLGVPLASGLLGADFCDVVYFFEPDCPDCAAVSQVVIPQLAKRFGEQLRLHRRDVSEQANFEAMMAFETAYGVGPREVPEFYTAHGAAWALERIGRELPELIERTLAGDAPGPHAAFLERYLRDGVTGLNPAEVIAANYGMAPLVVHEFWKSGCRSCSRVSLSLRYLAQRRSGRVEVYRHDLNDPESQVLLQAFCTRYAVPENLHLVAPAVFCGKLALVGKEAFRDRDLVKEIEGMLEQSARGDSTPEPTTEELAAARQRIAERFGRIAWPAVLVAGLLDGINPCAFVTIIFLLSYLSLRRYGRRDAMLVGATFAGSVFLVYLLIGVGALRFAGRLQELPQARQLIHWLAVALAGVVGVLNLRDAWLVWRGGLGAMELKIDNRLRAGINALIRRQVRLRHFVAGAVVLGAAVAILELACTGQVYLPTILFMLKTQGAGGRGLLLLAGYNLAFILPLIVVFLGYGYGVTSQAATHWLERHGVWVKFGTGVLFLGIAGAMLYFA